MSYKNQEATLEFAKRQREDEFPLISDSHIHDPLKTVDLSNWAKYVRAEFMQY